MNKPYSIKIFLPDGEPDGLRIIEKSNWNGVGLVVPRSLFGEAKKRKEFARTGVYVLVGPPEESGLPRVYVGEGDPIKPRLDQHATKRDFWTSCIAFTSKDDNLNKAHVQYLEARLIELAAQAKRCVLDNGNVPTLPSLSEADGADAEGFLAEMLLCFPVLGLNVFSAPASEKFPDKKLYLGNKIIRAEGAEIAEGFLVRTGSLAVKAEVPSCLSYIKNLRSVLISNGVLKQKDDGYAFSQDYVFSSPSTAAEVILGYSVNGRTAWKTKKGKTLKQIQEAEAKS
jgi:hypothetical protein